MHRMQPTGGRSLFPHRLRDRAISPMRNLCRQHSKPGKKSSYPNTPPLWLTLSEIFCIKQTLTTRQSIVILNISHIMQKFGTPRGIPPTINSPNRTHHVSPKKTQHPTPNRLQSVTIKKTAETTAKPCLSKQQCDPYPSRRLPKNRHSTATQSTPAKPNENQSHEPLIHQISHRNLGQCLLGRIPASDRRTRVRKCQILLPQRTFTD